MKLVFPVFTILFMHAYSGFQHMFAMFGATILVPILTASTFRTRSCSRASARCCSTSSPAARSRPSSARRFAFLGGYATIAPMLGEQQNIPNLEMLPYACFGVACAGLVYVILAGLFKVFGAKKVMRFFPPIVTGPIIIAIGLNLSSSAINNCTGSWWIAIAAILIIVAANIWGKGMIKIIPILLGVIGSYLLAVIFDADVRANLVANVSRSKVVRAAHQDGADRLRPVRLRQCRRTQAPDRRHHHRPAVPCHHGRAHRRRVRDLLHLQPQLH